MSTIPGPIIGLFRTMLVPMLQQMTDDELTGVRDLFTTEIDGIISARGNTIDGDERPALTD